MREDRNIKGDDKELDKRFRALERKMTQLINDRFDKLEQFINQHTPKTLLTQEELADYLRLAPSTMRKRDKSIYPSVPLPDKDGNPSDTVRYIKEEIVPMLMSKVM